MIRHKCSKCGVVLENKNRHAGKKDRCPHCRTVFRVPVLSAQEAKTLTASKRITGSLGATAVILFFASMALPMSARGPRAALLLADPWWVPTIAGLVFLAAALAPVLRPVGKTWVFPLLTSLVLLAIAVFMFANHFSNRFRTTVLFTICVFTASGVALLAEALKARRVAD